MPIHVYDTEQLASRRGRAAPRQDPVGRRKCDASISRRLVNGHISQRWTRTLHHTEATGHYARPDGDGMRKRGTTGARLRLRPALVREPLAKPKRTRRGRRVRTERSGVEPRARTMPKHGHKARILEPRAARRRSHRKPPTLGLRHPTSSSPNVGYGVGGMGLRHRSMRARAGREPRSSLAHRRQLASDRRPPAVPPSATRPPRSAHSGLSGVMLTDSRRRSRINRAIGRQRRVLAERLRLRLIKIAARVIETVKPRPSRFRRGLPGGQICSVACPAPSSSAPERQQRASKDVPDRAHGHACARWNVLRGCFGAPKTRSMGVGADG